MKKERIIDKTKASVAACLALIGLMGMDMPVGTAQTQPTPLHRLQQEFVDLGFGMFIHYGMPTFMDADWSDPQAPLQLFDSPQLDAGQWAKAAQSANMTYGCLTTKHHSGFPIWDTKTTDYNVMNTPLGRDVVKEYADAFRAHGLKVMLYYSILDTHHGIRPNLIDDSHVEMIKAQLTELLTDYGDITALIIDGWDAPWSRISYDDVPFEDIYLLVKSIQPSCLVMDLNAAKYPAEQLFYTDIKSYEQGAGQFISKTENKLPALACLPLQTHWFWKTSFPDTPVKDVKQLIEEFVVPYNDAYCNFILNVAPNKAGLMDENALEALKEIGQIYAKPKVLPTVPLSEAPIIASNIAKFAVSNSSWSNDMHIMDFANDDNFRTAWVSYDSVERPWLEVKLDREKPFNMVVLTEREAVIGSYHLDYFAEGSWKPILEAEKVAADGRVTIHRFDRLWGDRVRIRISSSAKPPAIVELGVYNERR